MNKSSFLNNKILHKSNIALLCIFGMFLGFLAAPALQSIATFLFGINGLRGIHPKKWFKNKYWVLGLLWIGMLAVSFFWSTDVEYWSSGLRIKLPFLILPLAFSYIPSFSRSEKQLITLMLGLLLIAGAAYSISFLISDREYYLAQYKISHLLPTPCRGDHISFSLSIVLYIIWAIYNWRNLDDGLLKWIIGSTIIILAVFIHVLAAKSGLIAFYMFVVLWSCYLAFYKKKLAGIAVLISIPLFLIYASKKIPTFKERKGYAAFSLFMLQYGDRSGNYGDVGRLMSYKISLDIINQYPLLGVGSGDLMIAMKKGYDKFYPQVEEKDMLVPHNQFLIAGVSTGIVGMALFAIWFLVPLTWLKRNRPSFYFLMTWLVLLLQLCIDTALEVQYGVFIFVFFLLLMKEELPQFANGKDQAVTTL